MEIVDRSLRETLRRLVAEATGGVTNRYSTRHVRIHENPLMVSFIRMTGTDIPWGIVYGRPLDPDGPRFKFCGDPRRPEALEELTEDFLDELLEYFGDPNFARQKLTGVTIKPEDMPQLWTNDAANLGLLQSLGFAYYQDPTNRLPSKRGAFGRITSFLFEHSTIVGHQLIVDATALLNNLYVLPADDYFAGHLSSTLAWIQSSEGANVARESAIRSLDKMSSITIDPDVENNLVEVLKSIPAGLAFPQNMLETVRRILKPELELRWSQLTAAWRIAESDSRPENSELGTLVVDSLYAFRKFHQVLEIEDEDAAEAFPRPPETDDDPIHAAFHYLKALEADDKFICYMVHDDRELLGDVFYDGTGFVGKVISVEGDDECIWKVELNEKFGRLLKKREGETYCLIGSTLNKEVAITGFAKAKATAGNSNELVWVVEFTWSKSNAAAYQMSTYKGQAVDKAWEGQTVVFVPSFAADLHDKAQKVVLKARFRRGAWMLTDGPNK